MANLDKVPELSLASFTDGSAAERSRFEADLMEGLTYFGFVVLKDHGISKSLLSSAYDASRTFFDLPDDQKLKYMIGTDCHRGYTPFGREHA
ncbi:MAG: 2-oxoglutarate and iron-dependent oxygenase domain-containing protein [Pseudomonadota bacterium]